MCVIPFHASTPRNFYLQKNFAAFVALDSEGTALLYLTSLKRSGCYMYHCFNVKITLHFACRVFFYVSRDSQNKQH
jgi:hypothetical protein